MVMFNSKLLVISIGSSQESQCRLAFQRLAGSEVTLSRMVLVDTVQAPSARRAGGVRWPWSVPHGRNVEGSLKQENGWLIGGLEHFLMTFQKY